VKVELCDVVRNDLFNSPIIGGINVVNAVFHSAIFGLLLQQLSIINQSITHEK